MKKVVIFFVSLLLTILSINLCLEKMIYNSINDSFTTLMVGDRIINMIDNKALNLTKYQYLQLDNDIRSDSEMNLISKEYLKSAINDTIKGNTSVLNISSYMNKIVDNISLKYNISTDNSNIIKDKINKIDETDIYNDLLYIFKSSINGNNRIINLLNVYCVIVSPYTTFSLVICILLLIIFCVIKYKNEMLKVIYKILYLTSALILGINILLANLILQLLYNIFGKLITMDFNNMILIDLICFVGAIIINLMYKYIKKRTENNISIN